VSSFNRGDTANIQLKGRMIRQGKIVKCYNCYIVKGRRKWILSEDFCDWQFPVSRPSIAYDLFASWKQNLKRET